LTGIFRCGTLNTAQEKKQIGGRNNENQGSEKMRQVRKAYNKWRERMRNDE
jgi:hypothetical protein